MPPFQYHATLLRRPDPYIARSWNERSDHLRFLFADCRIGASPSSKSIRSGTPPGSNRYAIRSRRSAQLEAQEQARQWQVMLAVVAAVIVLDQSAKWWAWRHVAGAEINSGGDVLVGRAVGAWYAAVPARRRLSRPKSNGPAGRGQGPSSAPLPAGIDAGSCRCGPHRGRCRTWRYELRRGENCPRARQRPGSLTGGTSNSCWQVFELAAGSEDTSGPSREAGHQAARIR
jgi:hypothetical protein